MSEKDLRAKYGGKLPKAINRAIRAEIPGGNDALDLLTQLSGPAMHSGWTLPNGDPTPEARAYFKHKRNVVDKMEAKVRANWQIPADAGEKKPRRRKSRGPAQGGSQRAGARRGGAKRNVARTREPSRSAEAFGEKSHSPAKAHPTLGRPRRKQ